MIRAWPRTAMARRIAVAACSAAERPIETLFWNSRSSIGRDRLRESREIIQNGRSKRLACPESGLRWLEPRRQHLNETERDKISQTGHQEHRHVRSSALQDVAHRLGHQHA